MGFVPNLIKKICDQAFLSER